MVCEKSCIEEVFVWALEKLISPVKINFKVIWFIFEYFYLKEVNSEIQYEIFWSNTKVTQSYLTQTILDPK